MVSAVEMGALTRVEQSMDVAFVIAGKLRQGRERVFNGL